MSEHSTLAFVQVAHKFRFYHIITDQDIINCYHKMDLDKDR